MVELVSSKSSPDLLLQETSSKMMDTSSNMMKISSTTQHMTTNEMFPTSSIVPQLSSIIGTSSYTMDVSGNQNVTKSMVNTTQTPSLSNTLFSYDMRETIDAKKSISMAETTSVTVTSSYPSDETTSSQFPKHPQIPSPRAHSSHFVLSTSAKTRDVSTNSRYQQPTVILESSPRFTSTADGLLSKTIILVKPSSYHATSSMSHAKGK